MSVNIQDVLMIRLGRYNVNYLHRYVFVVFARQATVVRFHENVAVLSDLCWLGQCDWGMRKMKTRSYLMVEPNHADTLPYVSVTS